MAFKLKRIENFNPSMKIEDIRLADKHYLVQWLVMSDSKAAETESGLWIPVDSQIKLMNVAKVLRKGNGCMLAEVGEYIVFPSITGENFNHLKPQPIYRGFYDHEGLFTIPEENVRAVIPEEKMEVQENGSEIDNRRDGTDDHS